ncbi:hypothetical protein C4566_01210 [Candidatus Parcubacteria bacterium]|nr:MAG: hypothetical protein C4566_01210 [Candidatus Parcubacteria bacterium]
MTEGNMDIKDKIKKFPDLPGVYHWLDKNGEILYVGRATSLKRRVAQYFQKKLLDPRIEEMVSLAYDVEYQVTDTILDSMILEANEIKKYWPKYNVVQKDDKSFIYIVIPQGDYPRPILVRARELKKFPTNKAHVFGPYQSVHLAKTALKIIRRIFPWSVCHPGQGKPCFEYQIGLCAGICVDKINKKDYQKNIKNIIWFLSGKKKQLLKRLAKESPEQAEAMKHIQDVALITREDLNIGAVNRIEGYDISHLTGKEPYGAMVVFSGGLPDKAEYRLFKIKTAPRHDDLRALEEVLSRRLEHKEWPRPDIMMIDGGKPQIDFIDHLFKYKNINIPLVGISKYSGDKLIFAKGASKSFRELAENLKDVLLQARDEAHRFGRNASRRQRNIK